MPPGPEFVTGELEAIGGGHDSNQAARAARDVFVELGAGRRQLEQVWPGILATLVLWLACGFTFGRYLADFAYTYVTYYAGLASAMIALVFLYYSAWIFIFGGELNAAIARARDGET